MRVLIADNQPSVRFALRVTCERLPGSKMVSEAADAADLICQVGDLHPDMVLLDWELEGMAAAETLCNLRKLDPHLFIIVLCGKEETRRTALESGVDAFVSKADPPDQLLAAIEQYWNQQHEEPVRHAESPEEGMI